jgi:phosphoheptose isomerase
MNRKIAIISEHASPLSTLGGVDNGGQNVYVAQVAMHLARSGYQVDVFTRRDREDLPEIYPWMDGLRVIHVPAGPAHHVRKEDLLGSMDEFTRFMVRFFKQEEPSYDLVHANFWMSGLVASELKHCYQIPYAVTFHALGRIRRMYQGTQDGFPDARFRIEETVIAEADAIIAECPQDEQDLIQLYQADPLRISVVPGGFDPDEVWAINSKIARRFLDLPEEGKIVLQLGRMVPRKGIDNVIQGFARLMRNERIPATLVVVGGETDQPDPKLTPEINRLQRVAHEEGIADQVIFTGRKNRRLIKYYYSAADVFVTTPWYEPFGITPLEAMACGVPVIGAEVGGIKYSVSEGKTGFLVPPNDPVALSERLAQLLTHDELRARMGENAIRWVHTKFTWNKVTDELKEVYEKTITMAQPAIQIHQKHEYLVEQGFSAAIDTYQKSKDALGSIIVEAANMLTDCFLRGNKVLVCGNGGSAADAQHFAGELVGRFKYPDRPALPVVSLNTDTSVITAWSNDAGYEYVFARQVEALARPGDILMGISTSGRSCNIIEAFKAAQDHDAACISLLGGDGGSLVDLSRLAIVVPASDPQRVQEVHILIIHLICELVDETIVRGMGILTPEIIGSRQHWAIHQPDSLRVTIEKTE